MPYNYTTERQVIFTEDGVKALLNVWDKARELIEKSGAVKSGKLFGVETGGNTRTTLACLDYLVETGRLNRVNDPGEWGQDQVFVLPRNDA